MAVTQGLSKGSEQKHGARLGNVRTLIFDLEGASNNSNRMTLPPHGSAWPHGSALRTARGWPPHALIEGAIRITGWACQEAEGNNNLCAGSRGRRTGRHIELQARSNLAPLKERQHDDVADDSCQQAHTDWSA